ncbi:MAG TPA: hypothetical protein PL003_05560 [Bacteroidales bacterium]|nr:hypothetical protein [Bacteroidales bacterium]
MKKLITTSILAVLVALATTVKAQDYPEEYLGLPGDNLNLYAVMKLFQESETLEAFERNLNDENSRINNLDLNGDNYVDYITVTDYPDGNVHSIVLRVALDRKESQDVAVFVVEKFSDGSAQIQLIGDEALYGKNYIIEPIYNETPNPGYMGRSTGAARVTNVTVVSTTPYQVSLWPVIRYIYMPNYVIWRSSWYWGYYPPYWRPWRAHYWHYYYGYHYNWYHVYYKHYRHWDYPRYARYNDFYYNRIRVYSPVVVVNINKGNYKNTYNRPEQRREGEVLFTKLHPDRTRRTATNTVMVRERRTSADQRAVNSRASNTERRSISDQKSSGNASTNRERRVATEQRSVNSRAANTERGTVSNQRSSNDTRVNRESRTPSAEQNRIQLSARSNSQGTSRETKATPERRTVNTNSRQSTVNRSTNTQNSSTPRATTQPARAKQPASTPSKSSSTRASSGNSSSSKSAVTRATRSQPAKSKTVTRSSRSSSKSSGSVSRNSSVSRSSNASVRSEKSSERSSNSSRRR